MFPPPPERIRSQCTKALEARIVEVARSQHRCITRQQLIACGLRSEAITYRARIGRLYRQHQGVYVLGPPAATDLERASAALLACGPESALRNRSGVGAWDLGPFPFLVEVVVPGNRCHPKIAIERLSEPLHPKDIRRRHWLRVTAPARTILDRAAEVTDRQLTRLVDDALRSRRLRLTRAQLGDVIARYPSHPGAPRLARHAETEQNPSRSDFEVEFVEFCEHHDLPAPTINLFLAGHELDAFFPEVGLIVECDGWDFHQSRASFESDRDRDADHLAAGLPTVRITRRRLLRAPEREAARLRRIIDRMQRQAA